MGLEGWRRVVSSPEDRERTRERERRKKLCTENRSSAAHSESFKFKLSPRAHFSSLKNFFVLSADEKLGKNFSLFIHSQSPTSLSSYIIVGVFSVHSLEYKSIE